MTGDLTPRPRSRTALLVVVFGGALVSGAWMLRRAATRIAPAPVNGAQLYAEVFRHLSQLYVDTLSDSALYHMSVNGLMRELGDPYSAFLPPARLKRLAEQTSGNYAGIGLQVDLRDGFVVVVNPLPGTPGERAGILTGDRIAAINGETVTGWTPEEIQRVLRGAPGSRVTLKLQRPGVATPITVGVTRAAIHQSAVRHAALLPQGIGYVDLQVFSDSTTAELRRAVDSLVHAGATSLMIDLRANPGGFLEQGVQAADLFLNAGQSVLHTRGRVPGADHDYVSHAPQRWPKLPVLLLVDERTASAAELFAGALQDHDRAVVLGLTTYGKGSAQNVYPIDDAGALKLTTTRWFTPAWRSISRAAAADSASAEPASRETDMGRKIQDGGGILPDVVVGDTSAPPQNIAFMRALGPDVGFFRDALASYALSMKASGAVRSPAFGVTPAMLDDVYRRMQARGIDVPRPTYDAAGPLVARLLSYEVDRYVFGAEAEFLRKADDDKMITVARRLMGGVRTQLDAFHRVERLSAADSAAQPPSP